MGGAGQLVPEVSERREPRHGARHLAALADCMGCYIYMREDGSFSSEFKGETGHMMMSAERQASWGQSSDSRGSVPGAAQCLHGRSRVHLKHAVGDFAAPQEKIVDRARIQSWCEIQQ